jgi:hypothetical protein
MVIEHENQIITHDGFLAAEYDGSELAHGDTVWIQIPGLEGIGDWAEIDEDGDAEETMVAARFWGEQYPQTIARANIKYFQLHQCECGATAGTAWRICHPEA